MLKTEKPDKQRISLTLTRVYVDALDQLVEEGVFESRTEIIKDGLRRVFRSFKMPQFEVKKPMEQ